MADEPAGDGVVEAVKAIGNAADLDRAISIAEAALRSQNELLGPDHLDISRLQDVLAKLYVSSGRLDEAEATERLALKIVEERLGPDHVANSIIYLTLAEIKMRKRDYLEAETLSLKALSIRDAIGAGQLESLPILQIVGHSQFNLGKLSEASVTQARSIEIATRNLRPNDPELARLLEERVNTEIRLKHHGEAVELARKSLPIREAVHGRDSIEVAQVLETLTGLALTLKSYPEAESSAKRAISIREKIQGRDSADLIPTLKNLALACNEQRKVTELIFLINRLLGIQEKAIGPLDKESIPTLDWLAHLYEWSGDLEGLRDVVQKITKIDMKYKFISDK